jgi:hypothetical protein
MYNFAEAFSAEGINKKCCENMQTKICLLSLFEISDASICCITTLGEWSGLVHPGVLKMNSSQMQSDGYGLTNLRLYTSTKLKMVNYWLYSLMHKKKKKLYSNNI